MPADVALWILQAREELEHPPEAEQPRDDSPKWEQRADGSRSMSFSTLEGLTAAIKASGGEGFGGAVKVGRQ
jgi:hypothetical protein